MEIRIRPLTVGPIVGYASDVSARIWGRGHFEESEAGPRRCFGALRYRRASTSSFSEPVFIRMLPNFDMTGLALLDGLTARTRYEYEMGWFFSDLEPETLDPTWTYEWDDANSGSFETASADATEPRTFAFGSCRYLLRLFGGNWFDNRGDKTFRSMLRQIEAGRNLDMLLMVGDQIYADDLNILSPDNTVDEYLRRYRAVFGQSHIRQLMSQVPTYMTLDDHEIEDNWPANRSAQDMMIKYPAAMHAYLCYQASHSPLFPAEDGRITGTPEKLWYTFRNGCSDFFVTDTRTERIVSEHDNHDSQIINQIQMEALKNWLSNGAEAVKFIVSSVPLFPDKKHYSDDKWSGFPHQRTELLEFIRENAIRRVVFLSGDIHVSMTAELVSPSDPDFKIVSVISSAFFWPYPHAKGRDYLLQGDLQTDTDTIYRLRRAGPVWGKDNFARVQASLDRVRVEAYSRKGKRLGTKTHTF